MVRLAPARPSVNVVAQPARAGGRDLQSRPRAPMVTLATRAIPGPGRSERMMRVRGNAGRRTVVPGACAQALDQHRDPGNEGAGPRHSGGRADHAPARHGGGDRVGSGRPEPPGQARQFVEMAPALLSAGPPRGQDIQAWRQPFRRRLEIRRPGTRHPLRQRRPQEGNGDVQGFSSPCSNRARNWWSRRRRPPSRTRPARPPAENERCSASLPAHTIPRRPPCRSGRDRV